MTARRPGSEAPQAAGSFSTEPETRPGHACLGAFARLAGSIGQILLQPTGRRKSAASGQPRASSRYSAVRAHRSRTRNCASRAVCQSRNFSPCISGRHRTETVGKQPSQGTAPCGSDRARTSLRPFRSRDQAENARPSRQSHSPLPHLRAACVFI